LIRAARLKGSPLVSMPARGAVNGMKFTDKILGNSASKMRTRASNLSDIIKKHDFSSQPAAHMGLQELHKSYSRSANTLTRKSKSTRIKTGLIMGGTGLIYQGVKPSPDSNNNNYNYQQQYY